MSSHLNEDCRKNLMETEKENHDYRGRLGSTCHMPGNVSGDFSLLTDLSPMQQAETKSAVQSLLMAAQMAPLLDDRSPRTVAYPKHIKYPNVFDSFSEAKSHIGFIAGGNLMLPDNVERNDTKMYEEVKIPATDPPPLSIGNNRILDEIVQIAFKELNRIQTLVYPAAYHSNEHLLVCAPTGASKTNVAMLTIVNTIRQCVDQGVIHRDKFEVVYVVPMKALATKMTSNFGKRLQPLGISVRELTGDMQLIKTEMQQTQMIITTPEK